MKNLVVIIFLISGSVLFGQNNLEQIIGVSGLRKFVNDSCSCKSVVETKYEYRFLGLKKKSRSFKKQYMKGLLVDHNGFEINYGETKNLILDQEKVFYYVCQPHVQLNMKGIIIVLE